MFRKIIFFRKKFWEKEFGLSGLKPGLSLFIFYPAMRHKIFSIYMRNFFKKRPLVDMYIYYAFSFNNELLFLMFRKVKH